MDRETLRALVRAGETPKYLTFWGHTPRPGQHGAGKECLSQWYPAPFEVAGVRYATAEHYMMAEKARIFGDERLRTAFVESRHPGEAKELGREVRGFRDEVWADHRVSVVVDGNLAKFAAHPRLRAFLLGTAPRVLVETSPRDGIWGIGLAADHPGVRSPETWRGLNLLGFALMTVRARLA
jgi:ribA/ribD-fused uncharacterized protein